jgi:hypothetical protein
LGADAINNRNRVTFSYELANDILLVAVPETSSFAMALVVCVGVVALSLARRFAK